MKKYETKLLSVDDKDVCRLEVRLNRRQQVAVELFNDDRYLVGTAIVCQAGTTSVLQAALTFMGWQEYPKYGLSLRADARLVMSCARHWPSANSERDLYDLTVGLAETAGLLNSAFERGLYFPLPKVPIPAHG